MYWRKKSSHASLNYLYFKFDILDDEIFIVIDLKEANLFFHMNNGLYYQRSIILIFSIKSLLNETNESVCVTHDRSYFRTFNFSCENINVSYEVPLMW